MPVIGGNEGFQTSLRPFVESLQQIDGESVLNTVVAGVVVDGVTLHHIRFFIVETAVLVIIRGRFVCQVDAVGVVIVDGVDETRYRHILVLHPFRFFSFFFLLLLALSHQTVKGGLAFHLDAAFAFIAGFSLFGFFAYRLSTVGTAAVADALAALVLFLIKVDAAFLGFLAGFL